MPSGQSLLLRFCDAAGVAAAECMRRGIRPVAVRRLPGDGPDGRATGNRTFKTFYGELREAPRRLDSLGVTRVAMEATGDLSMTTGRALLEHGNF
jgi:hypothetical protein